MVYAYRQILDRTERSMIYSGVFYLLVSDNAN